MTEIVKADGSREAFDETKLLRSLKRSGSSEELAAKVLKDVKEQLVDGMSTKEIYRDAFKVLRTTEKPVASRYSLRRAILELGPTGFPFEDFIAEIFKVKGYQTETDRRIQGFCVEHEVDLIARKEGKCIGAEAKFHNQSGIKSDLKVALYVHARFEDIIDKVKKSGDTCELDEGWLITNTKFTSDAITFGECSRLTMIGWSYPRKGNLQDLIEETKVHPLTCLTTLSKREKDDLLRNRVVLCKTLQDNQAVMRDVGIKGGKIEEVLKESNILCQP